MEEEQIKKEMLLRMIMRCNKVRKHKPKKVKDPVLKIGVYESREFPESVLRKQYRPSSTLTVRNKLRNVN